MGKFVAGRLLDALPVLFLSSLLVFGILHLIPGDPIDEMVGASGVGDPQVQRQQEDRIRLELGLDNPLPIQYLRWIGKAVRGDLGESYIRRAPVLNLIADRLPSTIELAATALVLSTTLGIALGIAAAVGRGSFVDRLVVLVALGGVSVPGFFMATLLILLFSVALGLLPATGSGGVERLILPAVVLGYNGMGLIARLTRASLLEVLGREYMTTARAKGLAERVVLGRHAMRNALIPIVTIVGLQLGHLLSGSVIVETVFARQGVGQLAVDAILSKDYPLVQGVILLTAASYTIANLLVDLTYGFIDPRIRSA